jgi:dolichol-phosphate mannosyltransferase
MASGESLTIGIPAYNEKDNIEGAVLEAIETGRKVASDFEVLVVDDASTDGTSEILSRLAREHRELRVVRHPENRGIVGAFQSLYKETRKDLLFMNASDRQWRMDEVVPMLAALRGLPCDLVIGNRASKQYTPYRKIISASFRILCESLFGVRVWDPGSIKLMRAPVRLIPTESKGVFEQAERIIRAHALGYRVAKVDVAHLPRASGRAGGASWRNIVSGVADLIRFYRSFRRERAGLAESARAPGGPRV